MTHKLPFIFRSCFILAAALSLTFVTISSCTKKSDSNDAAKFIGTWNVAAGGCANAGATLVFAAGSGSNTLTNSGTVGNTGCVKAITATGTASGNSFNFPAQTFTDGCGLSYSRKGFFAGVRLAGTH